MDNNFAHHPREKVRNEIFIKKPVDIKNHLDQYVVGQDKAKKVLSVAIYNHYKRLEQDSTMDDVEIEKSNIIMVGDTGTGKTLLAKTIAKILQVPFCIADATAVTEAGYVGEDVETIMTGLLRAADYEKERAEKGIVYIDEIDKIARKSTGVSITRDVGGEGVQQGLLKLLEGSIVNVPPRGGRKHPEQKMIPIDTKDILFICGGAFEGINKIIKSRLETTPLGFKRKNIDGKKVNENTILNHVNLADIRSFGLIPELVGRLPVITHLDPVSSETLKMILTEPKNSSIRQYQKLFKMEGINLNFTDDALNYIVKQAVTYKLGARGLRSICEIIMLDTMFNMPSSKTTKNLIVDEDFAREKFEETESNKNLDVA